MINISQKLILNAKKNHTLPAFLAEILTTITHNEISLLTHIDGSWLKDSVL